jgi:ATP-dependent Lon protease
MTKFFSQVEDETFLKKIPNILPILPLRNSVAFPFMPLPLSVNIPRSMKLIEDTFQGDQMVGLAAIKDSSIKEPMPGQIFEVGTVCILHRIVHLYDNTLQVFFYGFERFRIKDWQENEPYLTAKISIYPDTLDPDNELEALFRSLQTISKEVISLLPNLPSGVNDFIDTIKDPRYLLYLVASNIQMEFMDAQKLLETDNMKEKLQLLMLHLSHERDILKLKQKIQSDVHRSMNKEQHQYYLRQQLKAIRKELGESEENQSTKDEYSEKIEKAGLPDEAKQEALRELKRIGAMSPHSAEYSVITTYLDWLLDLPWNMLTEDHLDIRHARTILDEDHYDLEEVKNRILEYLAVRQLVNTRHIQSVPGTSKDEDQAMGAILCFSGPPGVGKTSLGQSIARSLGRKFTRMSLGGLRDEAEIRSHRRTYIGAMPGRIIQAIKRVGTRNPVFMLDEVDKIGSDWRGDPSSALLEVLDPAQNSKFRDHYLDVDFDLSDVIFITTANQLEPIPLPLKDRMEIIHLEGYTEYEKIMIAKNFLVNRQLYQNGLTDRSVTFGLDTLRKMIQGYTREAGVRNLEREIGTICRRIAVKIVSGELANIAITADHVREFLKKEKYESESAEPFKTPGIATGLSVTAVGGDILFIEVTRMKGKGAFLITGQLGDIMRESAQIAHSYIRSKAEDIGIDPAAFKHTDVHIHVPAGAIPKDGPSAGITLVAAMASLFSGRVVCSHIGMTGEITLRGRVLPVGGIKMKVLAAHRAGLTKVILPKRNENDVDDLPIEVRQSIQFYPVEWIDQALEIAVVS